jgi:hypothetical protein
MILSIMKDTRYDFNCDRACSLRGAAKGRGRAFFKAAARAPFFLSAAFFAAWGRRQ